MLSRQKLLAGAALVAASLAVFSGAFAQGSQGNTPPSPATAQGQGSMPGQGMMGMMGMMGQMDPAQMNRMMENCNKMMESRMQPPPGAAPSPEKKG